MVLNALTDPNDLQRARSSSCRRVTSSPTRCRHGAGPTAPTVPGEASTTVRRADDRPARPSVGLLDERRDAVLADRRSLERQDPAGHRRTRGCRSSPSPASSSSATPTSTCRRTSTSRSSTWTGRAAATPTSPRSPRPTASSTAAASGTRARPTRTRCGRRTPSSSRRSADYVDGVGANFGRVRMIKLEPQDREQAIRSIHRDDNNRFNPDDEGWVVRSWLELTDNPDSYMLLMDNGADGLPDPATERRRAAAPRRPLRRRHPAPVARRRAQRRGAPLRADHQLRVGSGARALDRRPARQRPGLARRSARRRCTATS